MLRLFDFTGNICSLPKECPSSGKSILAGYDMKAVDIDFEKVFESCSSLEHLLFKFLNIWLFAEEGYEAPTRLPFDLNSANRFTYLELSWWSHVHCGDEE